MAEDFRNSKPDEMEGQRTMYDNPFEEIEMYLQQAKNEITTATASPIDSSLKLSQNQSQDSSPPTKVRKPLRSTIQNRSTSPHKLRPNSPTDNRRKYFHRRPPRKTPSVPNHHARHTTFTKDFLLQEWSQDILKDFQSIVQEEIKSLKSSVHADIRTASKECWTPLNETENQSNEVQLPCTKLILEEQAVSTKMGATYSGIRAAEEWAEENSPFRTYTLPRHNQRSVSLANNVQSSTHPDDKENSCRLISMTQHRFSRSHSLDEGRGLSTWALHHLRMIDDAHRSSEFTNVNTLVTFSEKTPRKALTVGVPTKEEDIYEEATPDFCNYPVNISKRLSNGWSACQHADDSELAVDCSTSKTSTLTNRRSSIASCTSALTAEVLGEPEGEWAWVDDDEACSLTDRPCSADSCRCSKCKSKSNVDINNSNPQIVVTDLEMKSILGKNLNSRNNSIDYEDSEAIDILENAASLPPKGRRILRNPEKCRKSEPSLPSSYVAPPSPLLGLPGLEIRRHTLPNPSCKTSIALDVPETPMFNTSSWEALPPAEEMEVMEDKPIQTDETTEEAVFDIKSHASRSLNSSLSSLSQLSIQEDFSENEWTKSSCECSPVIACSALDPLLVENNLSPDVFFDPSQLYAPLAAEENRTRRNERETRCIKVNGSVNVDHESSVERDRKGYDVCDASNINIQDSKTTGSEIKLLIEEDTAYIDSNLVCSHSVLHSKEANSGRQKIRASSTDVEPITGVLHISPMTSFKPGSEVIFSVKIPERKESFKATAGDQYHTAQTFIRALDRRKSTEVNVGHDSSQSTPVVARQIKKLEPNSKISKSINSILSEIEDAGPIAIEIDINESPTEKEISPIRMRPHDRPNERKRKKTHKTRISKSSCETFSDFKKFLREVETRIPPYDATIICSAEGLLSPTATSSVGSQSSTDLLSTPESPSLPTEVFDAFTQTSPTPPPLCGSPTTSFTWMSDCGCDGYSLEPCASSVALSGTEDDLDEDGSDEDNDEDDDWSGDECSLSSSPPITPISPTRDDSSLSLSESPDNLEKNVESGIGTVSTRPSTSPPILLGTFDLSGSNLSSEDTGLEASFERKVRRYLPNTRGGRSSDHSLHYKRRRQRLRQHDHWVRQENQTTQTEPHQFGYENECTPNIRREIRASSEEARHNPLADKRVRQTHSEPRLSASSNHSLSLRIVSSEAALPPLPRSHSRSFTLSSSLPPLTEDKSLKGRLPRPRELPLLDTLNGASKAISAPILESFGSKRAFMRSVATSPSEESSGDTPIISQRTQSAKEIPEIEALDACTWLRAAGFPQYAQMYEDFLFPLDLVSVERDHSFLDSDSIQALFRRLRILNRCAKARLESVKKPEVEDSDEEDQQCALAGNWKFQRHSRRWSRIDSNQISLAVRADGRDLIPNDMERLRGISEGSDDVHLGQFKRSGSEKLKDGAKALLRRMESLKNKKKRRYREGIVISSPKVLDEDHMKARMIELGCIDISPEASPELNQRSNFSSRHRRESTEGRHSTPGEDSSSVASDHSLNSTPLFRSRRRRKFWGRSGGPAGVGAAYSDSECSPPSWRHFLADNNLRNEKENYRKISAMSNNERSSDRNRSRPRRRELRHTASLTYGKDSPQVRDTFASSLRKSPKKGDFKDHPVLHRARDKREMSRKEDDASLHPSPDDERLSVYDNVPLIICNKTYHDFASEPLRGCTPEHSIGDLAMNEGSGSSECTMESRESPHPSTQDDEEVEERPVRRNTIDRWHSFNRKSSPYSNSRQMGTQIYSFSVGQMNHLRKRALLRLTALMERYCPANRTTWNWELPKFMRKIKTPDYKDRLLFGVPLQVINQRMGQPLPPSLLQALNYLKTNCLDQVGLFRKPGVRSRIHKLRELHENEELIHYASFGPCDIADMVKTYFRELPEVLLTNKLSEIFITICQYLPEEVKTEALQCVVLMMPDENREVLMVLLGFLAEVAANSHLNQMTASNLSVCMAPSLFHLNLGNSGSSPLRRRATGAPEQKDLHDNKAAHQCLTLMIQQINYLQCLPMQMLSNCSFTYLDQSQPVSLDGLGEGNWMTYMNACVSSLLKESRDKSRGWMHVAFTDPSVELGYRKVGDGHPLRLWKVTTEVEAPPTELLTRILRERHLWDDGLLKWRVITRLNREAEVFQYVSNSMLPRPPVDFCVLRCWRTNIARGMCVVVETSIEHPDSNALSGGLRGVVLASRYLIQPCGSGKSRITHISRVDMRGRLPEWYNKNYPYIVANHIVKLRQSFHHYSFGPESKV